MDKLNTSQIRLQEEAGIDLANEDQASPALRATKKKTVLLSIFVVLIIAAAVAVGFAIINRADKAFGQAVSEISSRYPNAIAAKGADGSYVTIDTNPFDKDVDEMADIELQLYSIKSKDAIEAIEVLNKKLGFSDSLYSKMLNTTALMGRQTDENKECRVSWTYHPDDGLEVMYEKK